MDESKRPEAAKDAESKRVCFNEISIQRRRPQPAAALHKRAQVVVSATLPNPFLPRIRPIICTFILCFLVNNAISQVK